LVPARSRQGREDPMTATAHGRRVVVGVDASQHAVRAADWAADEAAKRGVALHVVHAFDFAPGSALPGPGPGAVDEPARAAHVWLLTQTEHRVREAHPGLPVVTELVRQSPAGALVAASREADLLVVGTRGRGGFAGLPLGSVSLRVVAHSHCPVVLLRSPGDEAHGSGDVVLGMEHGESQDAVRFAFEAAARAGTGVRAVHAWAPYPGHAQDYISDTDILARLAAEDMVAVLKDAREQYLDVPVKISVMRGHPAAVLADASRGARLTVVGAHRHHGPLSLGVGPIIQALLAGAESPVAVVPVT
jgi:nucleotide-binding universal stress UspA family protein